MPCFKSIVGWWVGGWVWVGDRVKRKCKRSAFFFWAKWFNEHEDMKSAGILLEGLQVDDSKKLSRNA